MTTREQWLRGAQSAISALFTTPPPEYHVSVGWPSRNGLSKRKRTIGECWRPEASRDGKSHIFISPMLEDPVLVLSVLLHEACHAKTPGEEHKGAFITEAKSVGLLPPWTSTTPSDELRVKLQEIADILGPFPHVALVPTEVEKKVQTTRMLKLVCPRCEYTVRTTKKWIDVGLPICPCGSELDVENKLEEKKEEE